jgi:hypothetical protein
MATPREDLRLEVPTLEPDPALVARLAATAAAGRSVPPRRRPGLRVGVATGGLIALSMGGAWAAATWVAPQEPSSPVIKSPDTGEDGEPSGSSEPGEAPDSDRAPSPGTSPTSGQVGDRPGRRPERRGQGEPGAKTRSPGHANGNGQDQGSGQGKGPGNGKGHGPGRDEGGGRDGGNGADRTPVRPPTDASTTSPASRGS